MIPRNELPEDAADWRDIHVEFPRLPEDTPGSCPESLENIMDYIRDESADLDDADPARLVFVRTAKLNDQRFWLWTYTESDGQIEYVVFQQVNEGTSILGLCGTNGLSPEQYMLAAYYDEIYWS